MAERDAPYHAHIYYSAEQRPLALELREAFNRLQTSEDGPQIRFVGRMVDGPIGPHPIAQYEIHFPQASRAAVISTIETTELRALVHPLTHDDLADHTTLAHWIGEPLELDVTVLDPPGINQGVPRFGKSDF